jgi:hypothetical protein
MTVPVTWYASGSYFEVCNCEAICPCRRIGGMKGGKPSYGSCDFLLSWHIHDGRAENIELSDLNVAMAGTYSGSVPTELWQVILYVDDRADPRQREALEDIFLGRAKGTSLLNFASAIAEVFSTTTAQIELSHVKNQEYIRVGRRASARTSKSVQDQPGVSCGIPGHDRPGQEIVADHFRVKDGPFDWNFEGRCGFASSFSYRND